MQQCKKKNHNQETKNITHPLAIVHCIYHQVLAEVQLLKETSYDQVIDQLPRRKRITE